VTILLFPFSSQPVTGTGTSFRDVVILEGTGDGTVSTFGGNDKVLLNTGTDTVTAGAGDDEVTADDGRPDQIDCGAGTDTITADPTDTLVGCELVTVNNAFLGTSGDDTIVGTAGDDTIRTGLGTDTVDAREGDDTICSALDDTPNSITCGAGTDTVFASFLDIVAADCEVVNR